MLRSLFGCDNPFFPSFEGSGAFQSIVCLNPGDPVFLAQAQFQAYQQALANANVRQDWLGLLNAFRPPEKPLDERFAQLKIDLAAALKRREASRAA